MANEEEKVKLLGFWVSPGVLRVKLALKLKGVDYEYIEEDIFNKSPLLLELNPVHKKVPVLVHGRKALAESLVILEYIDETWQNVYPLMPQDPYQRAMARFWANFAEKMLLYPAWAALSSQGEEKDKALKQAQEAIAKIEEELQAGNINLFVEGENIGYLDIVLAWISYMLPVWEEVGSMKIIDPFQFPATTAWVNRLLDLPLIKDNLPPRERILLYYRKRIQDLLAKPRG
uniref:Glutathione S-transferase n=1 Tax=Rhizophora mucronata TaxID=61149 RepID=A0A2P2J353_RHIMU